MAQHSNLPLSDVKCAYINQFLTGSSVLDIGAGKGHYCLWLRQDHSKLDIHALDWKLIDLSSERITFKQHNLEDALPFPANSFSTLLAFDIIEHIVNEQSLLKNMLLVCKPNGTLIGSVPHDVDLFLPAYNLTFYHRSDVTHKRYYTEQSLRIALETAGFKNIVIHAKGGVAPQVFAEFFPKSLHWPIKKMIGLLRRIGIIDSTKLRSDLFFVAHKSAD